MLLGITINSKVFSTDFSASEKIKSQLRTTLPHTQTAIRSFLPSRRRTFSTLLSHTAHQRALLGFAVFDRCCRVTFEGKSPVTSGRFQQTCLSAYSKTYATKTTYEDRRKDLSSRTRHAHHADGIWRESYGVYQHQTRTPATQSRTSLKPLWGGRGGGGHILTLGLLAPHVRSTFTQ